MFILKYAKHLFKWFEPVFLKEQNDNFVQHYYLQSSVQAWMTVIKPLACKCVLKRSNIAPYFEQHSVRF